MIRITLLLIALTGSAFAQTGVIRGKVRVPSGVTLTGVIVELWRSGSLAGTAVTSRDGDFEFSGLSIANYEVIVKHQGYQPAAQRVEFYFERGGAPLEVQTIELMLRPLANPSVKRLPTSTTFVQDVPPAARSAFEQGSAKLKEGKASEAATLFTRAIEIFPSYFDAHFLLALEHDRQGRDAEALAELERSRAINDRDARVYYMFGVIMSRARKYVTAEYAFRNALERDPTHAQSSFSHGVILIELARSASNKQELQERLAEAEAALTRAITLSDQQLPAAYLQRARVYELRGNRRAAATDLTTYLKLNPHDKNAKSLREAIDKFSK